MGTVKNDFCPGRHRGWLALNGSLDEPLLQGALGDRFGSWTRLTLNSFELRQKAGSHCWAARVITSEP